MALAAAAYFFSHQSHRTKPFVFQSEVSTIHTLVHLGIKLKSANAQSQKAGATNPNADPALLIGPFMLAESFDEPFYQSPFANLASKPPTSSR